MSEYLDKVISLKRQDLKYPTSAPAEPYDGVPCVTLNCPEILKFPEEGCITFRYKRGQIIARSATRMESASCSATFKLLELCEVTESEDVENDDEKEDGLDVIDRLFDSAQEEAEEKE